ncbi:MAG: PorT family protein [Bacteroidetes bacterium]|nr:PorT family protein [Bacteroidota bacterium]
MQKAKLILVGLLFLSALGTSAQGLKFGPKVGANLGKIEGQRFSDQYELSYHAGFFLELKLGDKWAFQPELLWNQVKVDTVSGFNNIYQQNLRITNLKLNYISVPVLLNYKPGKVLTLQAGPQFGILTDRNKNLLQNGVDAFKQGDLSMLAGAQLNILSFRIYGRYVIGLSDISDLPNQEKWRNQGLQVGVGLAF